MRPGRNIGRMRWLFVASVGLGPLVPGAAEAGPPKELYGKSVTVSWNESREQRPVGEETWRRVDGIETLNMYISDAGRVFNRQSAATRGGSADRKGEIAGQGNRSINSMAARSSRSGAWDKAAPRRGSRQTSTPASAAAMPR